ncbi:uncharacterized protein LOC142527193 [Primulina tabacum]|uniref:uncharacterized protein LOC142527193 n=1 Tax=Primulina tabacum TaxID=48773 RepID=UPI003F5AC6F4
MATTISPSSSSPHDDDNIPTATLALPSIAIAAPTTRRLPPPCWSPEETLVLIDAYKEKWYSLNRGNLRANHWQEVADHVASRFHASPSKTAVQCRHKMEKLRKRYRAEIQRAAAHGGVRRFSSSWAHFQSMHAMEKGHSNPTPPSSDDEEDDFGHRNSVKRINDLYRKNQKGVDIFDNQGPAGNGSSSGFRIKIPGMVSAGPDMSKAYGGFNDIDGQYHNNPNPRFTNSVATGYGTTSKVLKDGFLRNSESGKRAAQISIEKIDDAAGVGEIVEAIQALGEGIMRTEKVKMDMARQMEKLRMQMELKRTEMILESQQRIVEAFAKTISERRAKKAKKLSSPEHES